MKTRCKSENARNSRCMVKRVTAFLLCAFVLLVNSVNVEAAENYYWPTPAVTDLTRGYSSSHKAIDIAAPEGTDIYATKSGTVIGVGNACSCVGNYPNCSHKFYAGGGWETGVGSGVLIKHDDGSGYSLYAHMTADSWPENVYEGAHVNQGQFIGKTGNAGNSTGPHLHFVLFDNASTSWWSCSKMNNNKDVIAYVYDYMEVETADNTRVVNAGATEITDTTAKIKATVSPYGTVTEAGFYLGTSPDSMQKYVESTTTEDCASIYYTLGNGKWTSALNMGTTYYYQIYGVIGGVTYKTSIGSFTTTGDSTPPVIESATVTDISSEGYTVEIVATDNVGVSYVICPTWTELNDQDDLIDDWRTNYSATYVSGNTYTYRANISEHNNERGSYVTHVYAYDASGNEADWRMVVEVPEPTVSVTGVSLNNSSLSLEVDETTTLSATVSPSNATNKNVTWTSSNTSVATVSNGVVKAVAPGTATITVTTADGGYAATCAVTVKEEVDENAPKIVVSSAKGTPGDTVTVTVDLENNPGFASLYAYLTYSDALTLVEAKNSISDLTFTNGASMLWDGVFDYGEDGELLQLTFTISEDTEAGQHFVKMNFLEAYSTEYDAITFATVEGYVEVIDFAYGDANGDNVINTKDIIILRQYLAGKDPITGESTVEIKAGSDANGDGVVNTKDIIILRQYLAAKDPITGVSSVVLGPNT